MHKINSKMIDKDILSLLRPPFKHILPAGASILKIGAKINLPTLAYRQILLMARRRILIIPCFKPKKMLFAICK
ncbi:MAG: hypothetical protein KH285_01160 [Anaerotruncus sp.]|nr:hypothetical protein [Anaerotruncus sp.]